MSRSRIILAEADRLDDVHPGDILREDFLIGSEIPVEEVARCAKIDPAILAGVISARSNIDASIDARLARYFGMSEGYFLRLQNS